MHCHAAILIDLSSLRGIESVFVAGVVSLASNFVVRVAEPSITARFWRSS